jgi:hypothetical protein
MGLLRLLALPVLAPIGAVGWVAGKVNEAVEAQWNDPKRIEAALLQLETRLEAGEITESAFEAAEAELLEELHAMRARRAGGPA